MTHKMMSVLITFLTVLGLFSCSTEPSPIVYGKDECALCKMLIVEKPYGAEIVNTKGKAFKFDSDECMVRYLRGKQIEEKDVAGKYVVNFSKPGKLIPAETAFYLQSYKLPSPMGAGLTSFETLEARDRAHKKFGGFQWTWEEAFLKLP